MAASIFIYSLLNTFLALFSCFAPVCLSYNFADENIIRLVSDGQRHTFFDDYPSFPRDPVEGIYQFGDSLADAGNLIRVDPSIDSASWPYGETYFNHPTGRFSDGRLMIDFFATFMNLPLIDAYLNREGDFRHGVNFAVAGATALNSSVLEEKFNISASTNLSLSVQLTWFKSHLTSFYPDVSERARKLAKGLFIVGEIGGNDYNYAFFQEKTLQTLYTMVPDVIQAIKNAIEEIIDLGATQIAIPGNFPIGCVPVYLTRFKTNDIDMYDEMKCLKQYNKHSKFHNDRLRQTIVQLRKDHPRVTIIYMDYFGAFIEAFQHAKLFGFDESKIEEACYGVRDNEYKVSLSVSCGKDVTVCENPKEYVSWDGLHLTQQAYYVIAKQLLPSLNDGVSNSILSSHFNFSVMFLFLLWILCN